MSRLSRWFSSRLPVDPASLRALTNEPVPNHLRHWWFALGGTPAYLFVVQVVTGLLLAVYYSSAPERAYASVEYITQEASYGWYLRSLHKWGATLMIAALVLHQMRVFFTSAYRRPREINWMIGVLLLLVTLMIGFTGYSLVYEQLSYWGATVGANLLDRVPVVGGVAKRLLLAGDTYNPHTLPRFYVLHAAVLPAALVLLIVIHVAIVRIQGVTELDFEADRDRPSRHFDFAPDHIYTELAIGLVLMIVLSALATISPAMMGPPADPLVTPDVIKPEWFFYVAFRWLKLFSGTAAILSIGFILGAVFFWPFIDAWLRKHTRVQEISVYIGIVAVLAMLGLTIWEGVAAH